MCTAAPEICGRSTNLFTAIWVTVFTRGMQITIVCTPLYALPYTKKGHINQLHTYRKTRPCI